MGRRPSTGPSRYGCAGTFSALRKAEVSCKGSAPEEPAARKPELLGVRRHHSWSTQHPLALHLLRILEQVFEEKKKKRIDNENRAASKKRSLSPQEQPFPTQDKPPLPRGQHIWSSAGTWLSSCEVRSPSSLPPFPVPAWLQGQAGGEVPAAGPASCCWPWRCCGTEPAPHS